MSDKRHNLLALLESAIGRLEDVLRQPYDEYMRDSAIQRFEFTFELFWKALKAPQTPFIRAWDSMQG